MDNPAITQMLETAFARATARAEAGNREEAMRASMIRAALDDAAQFATYIASMREWLADVAEDTEGRSDFEIIRAVRDNYSGGIGAFIQDEGDNRFITATEDRMMRLLAPRPVMGADGEVIGTLYPAPEAAYGQPIGPCPCGRNIASLRADWASCSVDYRYGRAL